MNDFDIGIIGAGVAGAFATLKIARDYPDVRTVVFDIGRPPLKRRRQLEGWLGCLPNSDGKLYLHDLEKLKELLKEDTIDCGFRYFKNIMSKIGSYSTTKDRNPLSSLDKKLNRNGYSLHTNDFIQIYPKDIHTLSKFMVKEIDKVNNFKFVFDQEVTLVEKKEDHFVVATEEGEYTCKKLLICVGRSGWRWASKLYQKMGIIENNDFAKFGVRIEMSANSLKEFNRSNCVLKKNDIEVGPFSWHGTVIPEDHVDMAISAFRSNENRWKTEKVSFNIIGARSFSDFGFQQTNRLGQLTFILTNDRIIKEKVSLIMNKKSQISIIPEYDWLIETIDELGTIIPELTTKAYYHAPTLIPIVPKINIGNNLETEVEGMYVAGENAGVNGILSAAVMGLTAVDSMLG